MASRSKLYVLVGIILFLFSVHMFRSSRQKNTSGFEQYLVKKQEQLEFEEDQHEIIDTPSKDLTEFLAEQYRRAVHVHALCQQGISTVGHGSVRNFVVPDRQSSLLFCPVYKAASTTWLIAMLQLRGMWRPDNTVEQLNNIRKSVFSSLKGFVPAKQSEQYGARFMVVRHPFERLLSCYRDKFENANKKYYYDSYGKKMMRMFRELPANVDPSQVNNLMALADDDPESEQTKGNLYANPRGPTFTEFVKYVVGSINDDEHWRPYHKHCAPCSIEYNFILRFEEMEAEGALFLQHLRAPPQIKQTKLNVFNGPPTSDVSCSYYSQLSTSLMKKLVTKYEPDLSMYEYDASSYLQCADEYVGQEGQ